MFISEVLLLQEMLDSIYLQAGPSLLKKVSNYLIISPSWADILSSHRHCCSIT